MKRLQSIDRLGQLIGFSGFIGGRGWVVSTMDTIFKMIEPFIVIDLYIGHRISPGLPP